MLHATVTVATVVEAAQLEVVDHHLVVDHHPVDLLVEQLNAAPVTAAPREPTVDTWESTNVNVKVKDACGVHHTQKEIHGALKSSLQVVTVALTVHQLVESVTLPNKIADTLESINQDAKVKDAVGLNQIPVVLHGVSIQLKLDHFFLVLSQ